MERLVLRSGEGGLRELELNDSVGMYVSRADWVSERVYEDAEAFSRSIELVRGGWCFFPPGNMHEEARAICARPDLGH
jgi:hypothetical protein